MTTTLKIEHAIVDFETWQRAFERDPIGRQAAGVLRYRICRPADDAHHVMIDLDFAEARQAEAFRKSLVEQVWSRADLSPGLARGGGQGTSQPRARVVEEVEARAY